MKKGPEVKISAGTRLEREAVRLLRLVPGLTVEPTLGPDVVLRLGDISVPVEVKAQRITNAATARQLIEYAKHLRHGTHLVVVAQSTTDEARNRLAEAGVGLIDATGTMRLDLPGLVIWKDGESQPTARPAAEAPKLAGKAGVAAQALLHDINRRWTIQDLAAVCGASTGLIHRLLVRLERGELVGTEGSGPHKTRRVTNPGALLDLWVEEMRDRGVRQARAYRLARDTRTQAIALGDALEAANITYAVTGAAAAMRIAPFLTTVPVTEVWVAEGREEEAVVASGADHVVEGHNVVFRSAHGDAPLAFRHHDDGVWLADTLRICLDVNADPRRGREQASRLREEAIGF